MYFRHVDSYTHLALISNGSHFVKYVTVVTVHLHYIHAFLYFRDIMISFHVRVNEKQCGHFFGPVWDLGIHYVFGDVVGPG